MSNRNSPVYKVWCNMRNRCNNPNYIHWIRYGGRGISICEEWSDFKMFHAWSLTNGYAKGLTLDRKDNDGDYEPTNCRWTTMKDQTNNQSTNHLITYMNDTKTLQQWCDQFGMHHKVLSMRLNRGWSIERALTEEVIHR